MADEKAPSEQPADQQPAPSTEIDKEAIVEKAVEQLANAKQPKTATFRDQIQGPQFRKAVQSLLGDVARADRFVRVALTALMRTPDLMECSQTSLFKCLLDLSSYGLEPDGRRAHLIPFRNNKKCQCGHDMDTHRGQECSKCDCKQRRTLVECTLIVDYKGLAELVRRSGEVKIIHADVVYSNDEWSYGYGSEAHLKHKPNLANRGTEKVAYYSYVRLKDGSEDFVVLSPTEVEKVRKRSKAAESGPWVSDYDEMGKKTAFRRHSKWLPLSYEVRRAVERDEEALDISGWEELIEEKPEALPTPPASLKQRLMQPKPEAGQ